MRLLYISPLFYLRSFLFPSIWMIIPFERWPNRRNGILNHTRIGTIASGSTTAPGSEFWLLPYIKISSSCFRDCNTGPDSPSQSYEAQATLCRVRTFLIFKCMLAKKRNVAIFFNIMMVHKLRMRRNRHVTR